ncbi:MAG: hypothetical protein EBU40_14355 [Proteobacteria bacterium]|nr:hypothetical protein [Pseudomonadota bacterium]
MTGAIGTSQEPGASATQPFDYFETVDDGLVCLPEGAAPGRLSVIKFWPNVLLNCAPTSRPMISAPPPGDDGFTMRTGRAG